MMGILMPETCWSKEHWINFICVASSWFFVLPKFWMCVPILQLISREILYVWEAGFNDTIFPMPLIGRCPWQLHGWPATSTSNVYILLHNSVLTTFVRASSCITHWRKWLLLRLPPHPSFVLAYSACRTNGNNTNGKRSFHRENMPSQ
jgi:hypothetical protein